MKKFDKFSRSKPTVHNQNKPFNKKKYGPTWEHIRYELKTGEVQVPDGANQPFIATLFLGKCGHIDLTYTELSRIMETCADAKQAANIASRLHDGRGHESTYGNSNNSLPTRRMI